MPTRARASPRGPYRHKRPFAEFVELLGDDIASFAPSASVTWRASSDPGASPAPLAEASPA